MAEDSSQAFFTERDSGRVMSSHKLEIINYSNEKLKRPRTINSMVAWDMLTYYDSFLLFRRADRKVGWNGR